MVDGNTDWRLQGDYFEGCNCDIVCPCIFLQDPDKGFCDVTLAWHIEKGHYDNIKLDGLNAVAVFAAPGNMFTGPKWKTALYVDEAADKGQTEALTKIFSGQVGGVFAAVSNRIGELLAIKPAPIAFHIEGKRRSLQIPECLNLEIEAIKGKNPDKDTIITNPTFTVAAPYDPVISCSIKHSYKDNGLEWDNTGKNAFYSKFDYGP